jgi:putative FmdB family regulatory protein
MIYHYRCNTCQKLFEVNRDMSDSEVYPDCGKDHKVVRLYRVPDNVHIAEHWNEPCRKALQRTIKYWPCSKENSKIFVGGNRE